MKKILLISLLMSFLFCFSSFAGNGSFYKGDNSIGRKYATILITGDETGNGTATITGADFNAILNRYIQKFVTTPGTGDKTPTAYTGTMTDQYGQSLTISTRSTNAVQQIDVPSTNGQNWPVIGPLVVTLTGLGEGNTVEVMIVVH